MNIKSAILLGGWVAAWTAAYQSCPAEDPMDLYMGRIYGARDIDKTDEACRTLSHRALQRSFASEKEATKFLNGCPSGICFDKEIYAIPNLERTKCVKIVPDGDISKIIPTECK